MMGKSRSRALPARLTPLALRAGALASLLVATGCASTNTLLASQATRAACAPTSGRSKVEFQVVNPEGRGLPGAQVTLKGMTEGTLRRVSGVDGWVSMEVASPGSYGARLELQGFRPVKVDNIKVATHCQVKLLVVLKSSKG